MSSRRASDVLNAACALLALGAASATALLGERPGADPRQPAAVLAAGARVEPTRLADGSLALTDAGGAQILLLARHRIASGSLLADPLLLELSAPGDIVAFSARAPLARDAWRYAGKPSVDPTRRVEHLLELKPDLVLVNGLGEMTWIEQLRRAGVTVFDLGPMWGVDTFVRNVLSVGWLVGRPEAARQLEARFRRRLDAIAQHVPESARRGGLYLGVHGNQLYGGTRGSSFHDVLTYAGLRDVAAGAYQGWPSYDPEALLRLDPEVIVTGTGMRAPLCQREELGRLRACGSAGDVIELDPQLLQDAGLGMLDAAEQLHAAAYPRRVPEPPTAPPGTEGPPGTEAGP
jgi:iron complex transport system substrate-binding protein